MKVLAIMVTRSLTACCLAIESLREQTLKPDIQVAIGHPMPVSVGELVCIYANKILSQIDLTQYEFLLKIDEDVILPKNFIEYSTALNYDLLGKGAALLIKTKPFLEHMDGLFVPNSFHAGYIHYLFSEVFGLKTSWNYGSVQPRVLRPEYKTVGRAFQTGQGHYRAGLTLSSRVKYYVFAMLVKRTPHLHFSALLGYLSGWIRRLPPYPRRLTK